MIGENFLLLLSGGAFFLVFVLLLLNAVYIYKVYYPNIARQVDGADFDTGFLFAASRFMHWGHFCLSRNRARKFGVEEVFENIPVQARVQLIFHWTGIFLALILLVIGYWLSQK